jgi:hypothetical protein
MAQGEAMKPVFYTDWVAPDDPGKSPEKVYAKSYSHVGFSPVKKTVTLQKQPSHHGVFSHYANPLLNGNCNQPLPLHSHIKELAFEKANDEPIETLLSGKNRLIYNTDGFWTLFHPSREAITQEDAYYEQRAISVNPDNFDFLDVGESANLNTADGKLIKSIDLRLMSYFKIQAMHWIRNTLVISTYPDEPNMPDHLNNQHCIALVPEKLLVEKKKKHHEDGRRYKVINSLPISFQEYSPIGPIEPVLLEQSIVQPLKNTVVFISYEGEIQKVIDGEFAPEWISASQDGILHMIATDSKSRSLWAISSQGELVYKTTIDSSLGRIDNPPVIAADNTTCVVGNNGIAVFDEQGTLRKTIDIPFNSPDPLFPLMYEGNTLTLGYGTHFLVIDKTGDIIFAEHALPGIVTTPLVSLDEKHAFIGTDKGLFALTLKKETSKK